MSVPEPLGFTRSILSFGLLFAGIPTGLIFYSVIVNDNELFKSRVSMNYFLGQLLKDDQLHIWLFFE